MFLPTSKDGSLHNFWLSLYCSYGNNYLCSNTLVLCWEILHQNSIVPQGLKKLSSKYVLAYIHFLQPFYKRATEHSASNRTHCEDLMVSELNSGSNGLGLNLGWGGEAVLPYITYTGYVPPSGVVILNMI